MLLSHCFKIRSLVLTAVLITGLGLVNRANAQSYLVDLNSRTATPLATLGGRFSTASAINDAGQLVGWSETAEGTFRAFITGPDGKGMRDLGTLGGDTIALVGINDAGQVAGHFQTTGNNHHAFITGPDAKGMRDLGTLGGNESFASGINNAGQVVGGSYIEGGRFHAFITGPDGIGMRDLGTFTGKIGFSTAHSINDAGQVAGVSSTGTGEHPFITGPDGMGMRDLDPSDIFSGYAWDINDAGQVVGQDGGSRRAFITGPDGMGMRDLGTFGGTFPFNSSEAFGINDTGQVVGSSFVTVEGASIFHAFVTGPDGRGMMDLNSLVDPPQGLIFYEATAINNAGQVIASVGTPPIPEPGISALFLAGLGLIGLLVRHKRAGGLG